MAHQVILCHIAYIYTADGNAAGRNIPKAGNQIGNRTLAAAGGADDCCDLSLLCYEGNIFKRLLGGIPGIRKTDILENDIIVCRFLGVIRLRHFGNIQNFVHSCHIPVNLHERF